MSKNHNEFMLWQIINEAGRNCINVSIDNSKTVWRYNPVVDAWVKFDNANLPPPTHKHNFTEDDLTRLVEQSLITPEQAKEYLKEKSDTARLQAQNLINQLNGKQNLEAASAKVAPKKQFDGIQDYVDPNKAYKEAFLKNIKQPIAPIQLNHELPSIKTKIDVYKYVQGGAPMVSQRLIDVQNAVVELQEIVSKLIEAQQEKKNV